MIGQTLSHYRILEKLGEGGMGVLYRALDTRLERTVAIKVLRPEALADVGRRRRLVQEGKAASALNHPGIVIVHDVGRAVVNGQDVDFIAMECVEGRALDRVMAERRLSVLEALDCAIQLAQALAAAHAAGIVHRDVKPANIMLSDAGRVKVLDFGLAKLLESHASSHTGPTETGHGSATETASPTTREGALLGTAAYMSPEQADGMPVDARSDVFSLGSVLYEMLAGRRPFQGNTQASLLTAILRDAPPPLTSLRAGVPRDLERIVRRCLAKDLSGRYASAGELLLDLSACRARLLARSSGWRAAVRRPRHAVPVGFAALTLVVVVAWAWRREAERRWAQSVALPEIARLVEKGDYYAAFGLVRQAQPKLPGDPSLRRFSIDYTVPITFRTDPPGADVAMKPYRVADAPWEPVGRTPLEEVRVPFGSLRWRIAREGFLPVEVASEPSRRVWTIALEPRGQGHKGMVRVSGGIFEARGMAPVELGDYWLDRFEVTNRQYREFLDRGGYRNREYWTEPFAKAGRVLSWEEAMTAFRDATGRPGPATWELGTYPEEQADHPVGGVSWFEAFAYARFAGKELPTWHHWNWGAGIGSWAPRMGAFADILVVSNFGGRGAAPVGRHQGLSPTGTYDMAGNAKEWCASASGDGRLILGGGWNEGPEMFVRPDAQSPWDRLPTYGLRCVKYATPPPPAQRAPIPRSFFSDATARDYRTEKPVSDDVWRIYETVFAYDKTELKPALEWAEEALHWRREKVSFQAAYGDERVLAHVFLPRNARPPYQTVIHWPQVGGLLTSSDDMPMRLLAPVLRSGRAVMVPVYKGMFERRVTTSPRLRGPVESRDIMIECIKDFRRSLDYLETRSDIDRGRLAYYAIGAGPGSAFEGGRLKAVVLQDAGLPLERAPFPEADALNHVARATSPLLMLNGRYDFRFPLTTTQEPLFRLHGARERDKRHVLFDSGQVVPGPEVTREILNWLDRYLGPVDTSPSRP